MKTIQLDADFFHNMSIIAQDEAMLKRVAKYLRRLVKQMEKSETK